LAVLASAPLTIFLGLPDAHMHKMIMQRKRPAAIAPAMTDFFFIVILPEKMILKVKKIISEMRGSLNEADVSGAY
jgi:hypothetical protein